MRLIALWIAAAAWGGIPAVNPRNAVNDFAGVLDRVSARQVERYAGEVREKTGVSMGIAILPSLEGMAIGNAAAELLRQWGPGDRVVLVLAIANRRCRIEASPGAAIHFPPSQTTAVVERMRPALRESHYGDAVILAAGVIGSRLLEAKGKGPIRAPEASRERAGGFPWVPAGLGAASAAVLLAVWLISGRKGSTAARRSHPEGGFGGFDSAGDGGGGFGGETRGVSTSGSCDW